MGFGNLKNHGYSGIVGKENRQFLCDKEEALYVTILIVLIHS